MSSDRLSSLKRSFMIPCEHGELGALQKIFEDATLPGARAGSYTRLQSGSRSLRWFFGPYRFEYLHLLTRESVQYW